MYIKVTYDTEFDDLIMHIRSKYSKALLNKDGIGEQLDLSKFSKKFFSSNVTADASVDANANVDDTTVISYSVEIKKPFERINSYFMLWKELRRYYGTEFANEVVEMNIRGDIYIHDFHGYGAGMPYSYLNTTSIIIKDNDIVKTVTMENLFDKYIDSVEVLFDKETINLSKYNLTILDENRTWVPLTHVLRHIPHNKFIKVETSGGHVTVITEDHPVILYDGSNVRADELSIGDELKPGGFSGYTDTTELVPANFAYLTGFWLGDGHINMKPSGTAGQIMITQNDVKNTKVYDIAKKYFTNVNVWRKTETCDVMGFGLGDDFKQFRALGTKCDNKVLPVTIHNWEDSSKYALISGLIDSDGTINPVRGTVDIRVTSLALVQQVADILRHDKNVKNVRTRILSESSFTHKDMYGVSFRIINNVFTESVKVSEHLDVCLKDARTYGTGFEIKKLAYLNSEQDWAYDITTGSGQFYCQGLIQHNCYNYSTYDVMIKGLPMIKKIRSDPPKYLYSFKSQLEQFITIASNSSLGATGIADIFLVMSYYVKNIMDTLTDAHFTFKTEEDAWAYVKETIVSFIYTINQPSRGGLQSAYVNISLYDKEFINTLREDYLFPDGTNPDIDIVQRLQEIYIDIMNGILDITPVTFPVTSACFSVDDDYNILDPEFKSFIAKESAKYGFMNFYTGKTSTVSSCCFAGHQDVMLYDAHKHAPYISSFRDLFKAGITEAQVQVGDGVYNLGTLVRLPAKGHSMYQIETQDDRLMVATEDHLWPIRDEIVDIDVRTEDLAPGDLMTFDAGYVRVKSVTNVAYLDDWVYCFEMHDESKPYFLLANGVKTHNCRLRSDMIKAPGYVNSIGGSSTKLGSVGVVSINLPRLAIISETKAEFLETLKKYTLIAARINSSKRKLIQKRIDNGNHPLYTYGFIDLKTQYSTAGLNGLNEALYFLDEDVLTESGQQFVLDTMQVINTENSKFDKIFGFLHNCEMVPGENMSIKMAEKDHLLKYQNKFNIYSNQFIPLISQADMLDRLKLNGLFDKVFSGGSICHVNIEQKVSAEKIEELIDVATKLGVVYWAINYNIQRCVNDHISVGLETVCPICTEEITDNFTRVVGFLTSTKNWHEVRRTEDYPNRQFYSV